MSKRRQTIHAGQAWKSHIGSSVIVVEVWQGADAGKLYRVRKEDGAVLPGFGIHEIHDKGRAAEVREVARRHLRSEIAERRRLLRILEQAQ